MRVVFMGYQTWGHRVLQALLNSRHEVVQVITHPESDHAYETIWSDSVADLATERQLPLLVRRYANDDEVVERMDELAADIIVSSDWRTWLSSRVYGLARHGAINIHDALLPRYGGFAPLNWAVLNGEREVGVTVHFMNDEFDLGDIVLQQRVPVREKDTVTDLFARTIEIFPEITLAALDLIEGGTTTWIRQDPSEATFFHKRSVEDSRINWYWPADRLANLVRAQSDPYPNAFAYHGDTRLRVTSASVSRKRYGGTPGRIFCPEGEGVVVVCGPEAHSGRDHGLVIERVRTEDGTEVPARAYFRTMGGYLTSHP
ncbi:methionyl-tRNA formyltransferase [Micromonospora humi]|uniref:Methionyl-tRNA formyltransferase n=1 Tax=Micromonospora humi TaxID=745366 RepID=A0A1C5IBS8_9ACTN|nr:methionyl-tRNA formyltransferase [Micromonospora humi]SCG55523.1 methionyl-tRNA formyltransferase [Micromonospora humi]